MQIKLLITRHHYCTQYWELLGDQELLVIYCSLLYHAFGNFFCIGGHCTTSSLTTKDITVKDRPQTTMLHSTSNGSDNCHVKKICLIRAILKGMNDLWSLRQFTAAVLCIVILMDGSTHIYHREDVIHHWGFPALSSPLGTHRAAIEENQYLYLHSRLSKFMHKIQLL